MDTSPITTYKDTAPSADDSAKENKTPGYNKKKRKRQHDEIVNPFFRPFVATLDPHATNKSHTFVPIAHLPRGDLPLTWLDHAILTKKQTVPAGALLHAQLESVHSNALKDCALTLVARFAPNGGLYVLERVGDESEVYIAYGLQPWVSESRVIGQSLGTGGSRNEDLKCLLDQREMAAPARLPLTTLSRTPKQPNDRRGAPVRLSLLLAKETSIGVEVDEHHDPPRISPPLVPQKQPSLEPPTAPPVPAEPPNVEQLRVQYLEALYTKTSLAYLAKGPLARARHLAQADRSFHEKLLDFYRESIISVKKLDFKYKESTHKVIEGAKSPQKAEEAAEEPQKASRKKKMGKDGLYPAEEAYIIRCWSEREFKTSGSITTESQVQEQRKLVADLRTRENKMQILLILEVMVLESLLEKRKEASSETQTYIEKEREDGNILAGLAKTPTKPKAEPKQKQKNYGAELETLLDRLCIWHTVGIDDMLQSPEKNDPETQKPSSSGKDQLRDFCADVVAPFYALHLPEQCNMILKKLGGSAVSPKQSKPAPTKSASTSRLPSGAGSKRRPPAVPRKTLERVLSDDRSIRHASPPMLARSSTVPLVPNLKREPSESFQRPGSRGALHKSVSFSNREIDLDADARLQEAKRKKLAKVAEQKKELDAAIAALKKPNRNVAGQDFMNEVESRKLDSSSRKQTVHITATPKRPKSRSSHCHDPSSLPTLELEDQAIPSSTMRPSWIDQRSVPPQTSAKKRAVLFTIHETPARPSSAAHQTMQKPVSRLNFLGVPKSDGISSDPTLVESTPATNRVSSDLFTEMENTPLRMSKSLRPVLFTPLKSTEVRVEDAFRDAPIIPVNAGKAMDRVMGGGGTNELSVYDALGWNDDYDL